VLQITSPAARGLLRAIVEDPTDDLPRLLLADVLEGAGDPRGEFIRVQIELARTVLPSMRQLPREHLEQARHYEALRPRERELFAEAYPALASGLPGEPVDYLVEGLSCRRRFGDRTAIFTFRRGFVASVTLTCADWCGAECRRCAGDGKAHGADRPFEGPPGNCPVCHGTGRTIGHGPALVLAAPIEEVTLTDKNPYFDPVGCEGVPDWRWVSTVGWSVSCTLPKDLHRLVWDQQKHKSLGCVGISCFPNEESALFALSRAALRWARHETGLPALTS
jgi:uncharacterized protein (TIGR02996 family)